MYQCSIDRLWAMSVVISAWKRDRREQMWWLKVGGWSGGGGGGGRGISAAALSTCFNARRAAEILCRPPSSYLFCILTPLPLRPAFWTVLLTQSWCRLNIHLVGGHIHRREAIVFPRISYIKVVAARMAALYHHSLATSCPRWHLPVEASLTAFWLLVTSCLYSISPAFVRTAGRHPSMIGSNPLACTCAGCAPSRPEKSVIRLMVELTALGLHCPHLSHLVQFSTGT